MSDIDEVSRLVGRLEIGVKTTADQQTKIVDKLDEISATLNTHCGKLENMSKSIEEMKPDIEDYKRVKQKGFGVLVGLGFIAGGAGAWMKSLIASFMR